MSVRDWAMRGCLFGRLRLGRIVLFVLAGVVLTSASVLPERAFDLMVAPVVAGERFDWIGWETNALAEEVGRWFRGEDSSRQLAAESGQVLAFVDRQNEIGRLNYELSKVYASQSSTRLASPLTEEEQQKAQNARSLENELDGLKQQQAEAMPFVEQILAAQVAEVLRSDDLGWADGRLPPVTFRFTDLPSYLVVSPRDKIYMYRGIFLLPDLKTSERVRIEDEIERNLGMSALVDDVGGIGSWPTMVIDTASLQDLIDIVAHEWTHTYLFFRPLGQHYDESRDLTTMNETVASLVGEEVARQVMERFYPEQVQPPAPETAEEAPPTTEEPQEETFSQAMRRIRLHVDELLAAGKVDQAEQYMETQRQELVEKGHYLRKLNQAYFAFHGSYATSPTSVDPIGPWMRQLRAQSGSLADFLQTVSRMTRLDDLLAALNQPAS